MKVPTKIALASDAVLAHDRITIEYIVREIADKVDEIIDYLQDIHIHIENQNEEKD